MAVSTRHLHRKHLRTGGEGSEDEFRDSAGGADRRRPRPRSQGRRRQSENPTTPIGHSLDDKELLSRFLFQDHDDAAHDGSDDAGAGASNVDVDDMPSMNAWEACLLSLAMEPPEVRNERIVMLFEAYALFGALYTNAVWILYEWGSWKGYSMKSNNPTVEQIFECVMAVALCCNILAALFAAWFWIMSIEFSSSHRRGNFVILSLKALTFLQYLLMFLVFMVVTGMFLGTYLNLSPHLLPDTIVALSAIAVIFVVGMKVNVEQSVACAPLEVYHHPIWIKATFFSLFFLRRRNRESLRNRAKVRAEELRTRRRASAKNDFDYPNNNSWKRGNDTNNCASSPVGDLLRTAATNLDKIDQDTSIYQVRLEEDWLSEPEQLRDLSVDVLSRYMPYGLAREVHQLVEQSNPREGERVP